MQELVAVLFATPAGNALDDDKCPGDDGHADQYGQNGFAQKIALGNEMGKSDVADGRFHGVLLSCIWEKGVIGYSG